MSSDSHLVQAIGMPAGMEWLVILIIALLLFGSKLPSVMRGLGGSIKEFKKGMDEGPGDKDKLDAKPDSPEGSVSRDQKSQPADKPAEKH